MLDRAKLEPSTLIGIGVAVIFVPWIVTLFFSAGPLAWVAVGGLFILVGVVRGLTDSSPGDPAESAELERINCVHCGARTSAAEPRCSYCEEQLT